MKRNAVVIVVIGLVIAATTMVVTGCGHEEPVTPGRWGNEPLAVEVSSLVEAEGMIGTAIPAPTYLPSDYRVQRIFVCGTRVQLLFSSQAITDPPASYFTAPNRWQKEFERPDGAKLMLYVDRLNEAADSDMWEDIASGRVDRPGEIVDLGTAKGLLIDPLLIERTPDQQVEQIDDIWYIEWWHSMLHFELSAPKTLAREQVTRIAGSVPIAKS